MESILTLQEEFENILQWTIELSRFSIIKKYIYLDKGVGIKYGDDRFGIIRNREEMVTKLKRIIQLYNQIFYENNGEISVNKEYLDKIRKDEQSDEYQTWSRLGSVVGYDFSFFVLYYDRNNQSSTIDDKLNNNDSLIVDEITDLIDDLYDLLKGMYDSYKKETTTHEENIKKHIQQISTNVNIDEVNTLEQVVNKYCENPWIKNLTSYCDENEISNETINWLKQIHDNYRVEAINNDIRRVRPSGCLFFFVKNDKPDFGEETKRFIRDFKKHFNTK